MNRNGGLWTGLIALLAVAVHLSVPSTQESGQHAASNNPGAGEKSSAAAEAANAEEFIPEGPWIATRYFFAEPRPVTGLPPDSKVTRDWFGIPKDRPVKFLLATVPDPLHTRLSLLTDSAISAIQDAAAKDGWEIATQWLPWTNVAEPDPKDIEKRTHARAIAREQEKQPGVLAFRHKVTCRDEKDSLDCASDARILLIFLIGETPTAGVNPFQFQLAREYMRAIQSSNESVRILGPTFSGSFQSLADRISEDIELSAAGQTQTDYFVKSGTASDQKAIDAFGRAPRVHFESLNSSLNFDEVLKSLRIPPKRAAVLVEDESGYGESEANRYNNSENEIRIFRFPRDISHLRNAYREAPASPKPSQPPSTEVDFSLKDADLGEDGIPEFSKTQTPLSQNSVLGEITNFVRREGIRVVQINATNVLDILFLSHVLKLQCPDTRIVVPYADLLFVEAAQSQALAGVLVESTYPMFAEASSWMGNRRFPATFSDANAQAFYNAAALLLQIGESVDTAPPLANYYWKGLPHPKWLLLVDREGLLPVRIWPSAGPPENSPPLPGPSPIWIALSGASTVLSLALVGWIWFMCSNLEPRILAQFALDPQEGSSPDRWRLLYLFSFALWLMALQLVLAVPFAHSKMTWDMALTKVLPDIGFRAALVVAVWSLLVALDVKSNSPDPKLLRLAAAIQFLFFLAFAGLWAICCFYGDDHAFFFSFRALELRIGSSPLWPILSGLAILLIFSATNISRLYIAVSELPEVIVEPEQLESVFQPRIKKSYDHLKQSFEAPLGIAPRDRYALLTIAVPLILLFCLGRPDVLLKSIDGRCYDALVIVLGTAALLCIGLTCVQITLMWESLRSFLSCLDTLPFACRFMKTDSSSGSRPIWVKQLNLQSIDVHSRALYVLHDITLVNSKHHRGPNQWTDWLGQYVDGAKLFLASASRSEARQRRHDLREISKTIAIEAFAEARRCWLSESLVGSLESPQEVSSEGASPRPHPLVEISGNTNKMGTLAEAFIALHYSPFLMYCVKQIQRLMLFLSVGLLLLVMSLNSYSVQSPQAIARFSLMLFVVVGAVALRCLLGIEKDPILSRIAGTAPGRLTSESYLKLIGYFALPTLGLLASQFPSISNFIYSWVAPTLQSAQ